ncbi:MAG TPA: nucleotidyltransferase domain-containing protein [Chloroflexota bacterium]|nr:nucleotidyltransferase domain-containing protein [Chloroflexota bacterium]
MKVTYPRHSQAELIALLRERIPALALVLPVKRVVLFGSWAKRRATAFSDVDLLVVYADPPYEDAYKVVWHAMQIRGLEPHVYSESEAAALQGTLDRMTRDGIALFPSDNVEGASP